MGEHMGVPMKCKRCEADPHPANFGSPRGCAFGDDGVFKADNWNCATINALLEYQQGAEHFGDDEHMEVVSIPHSGRDEDGQFFIDGTNGWIVTARYKHRGRTDAAVHISQAGYGPVTLALVNAAIEALEINAAYEHARSTNAVDPHARIRES